MNEAKANTVVICPSVQCIRVKFMVSVVIDNKVVLRQPVYVCNRG